MEYVVKYSGELQYLLTFPKDFDPANWQAGAFSLPDGDPHLPQQRDLV